MKPTRSILALGAALALAAPNPTAASDAEARAEVGDEKIWKELCGGDACLLVNATKEKKK